MNRFIRNLEIGIVRCSSDVNLTCNANRLTWMLNVWPVVLRLVNLDAFLPMYRKWISTHHLLFRSFDVQIFSTIRYNLQHCKQVDVDFPATMVRNGKVLNVNVFGVIRWNCYCHDIFRFDEIEWWMKGKKHLFLYSSNPLNKLYIMTLELVMFGLLTSIKYSAGYSTQSQILKIAYEKNTRVHDMCFHAYWNYIMWSHLSSTESRLRLHITQFYIKIFTYGIFFL